MERNFVRRRWEYNWVTRAISMKQDQVDTDKPGNKERKKVMKAEKAR